VLERIREFITDVKRVIKEVTWPKANDLTQLTVVVVLISIVAGAFLGTADFLFTKLISWVTLQ